MIDAAEATIALWGNDGLDFEALAADIAAEATIALEISEQIALDRRIADLYTEADPDGIVRSAPGVGDILAAQITGRLGAPHRFTNLAAARSFSGLVPPRNASGLTDHTGGPTKRGDACLRAALFQAADRARKVDPTLAAVELTEVVYSRGLLVRGDTDGRAGTPTQDPAPSGGAQPR